MPMPLLQKESQCNFSFPCAEYHDKCQATADALRAETKELAAAAQDTLTYLTAITGYDAHKFAQVPAMARLTKALEKIK